MTKFKFNQTHNFNWYTIVWIAAFLLAIYLFNVWHINQSFFGIVENKSHLIGAQESGKVHKLLVTVGDQVEQGQILAVLDISDLKTGLNQLREELTNIQKLEGAHNDRFSIFIQRMSLELENEAGNLINRLSMIESKSTELAGLNAEVERLQNAEKAGLGYSRDLANLILQRDALASYLRQQNQDVQFQKQKLEKTRQSRTILEEADIDSMAKSVFLERMEHAEMLRRQVSTTENRIKLRTLVAPCDGFVTEVLARSGDVVQEFIPIITVDEIKPKFLTMYIPENSTVQPEPGMQVEITSSRSRDFNTTGIVTFVHPGFSRAGERLSFRGQIFWARKVLVALNKNHDLIPGEVINARLGELADEKDYVAVASASENASVEVDGGTDSLSLQDMQVPQELVSKSRFEPSGIVWIPELKKYLIVSDDTGVKNANSEHAPYLFFMDDVGKVEPNPIRLSGVKTVNDLEAITYAGYDVFYLVSSQNISKKGKRPKNREQILKMKRDGEAFQAVGELKLMSWLMSLSREKLISLGLEKNDKDGKPVLNIEGAAFFDGDLYLGLKEPVSDKGAIIWKLEDVEKAFASKRVWADQLSVYGTVDLGQHKNRFVGFSDLTFDKNGILWALGTIADIENKDQMAGFFRIKSFANGGLEGVRLMDFPGMKPEGICQQSEGFLIVFDKDDRTPAFCVVAGEAQ